MAVSVPWVIIVGMALAALVVAVWIKWRSSSEGVPRTWSIWSSVPVGLPMPMRMRVE